MIEKIKNWVYKNRFEALILTLTLLVGSILRLYRIDEYMTFLGDEGRDAIIVRRLLVNFDPILIGPGTSIGNMYLGPLYYYLIAPFLFLANYSPVGPSVMVALLSIVTIYLIWHAGREWFGRIAGNLAAFFYAISPIVVIYSRSSWNPNIMPFFSLLSVYSLWKVFKKDDYKWLIVAGFSLAMALNSHYLALILFPLIGFFLLIKMFLLKKEKNAKSKIKGFLKNSLIALGVLAVLMSPLVIFDARHEWRNFNAMKKFFTERQTTVSAKPWNSLPYIYPNFEKINTRLLAGTDIKAGKVITPILSALLFLFVINIFLDYRKSKKFSQFMTDNLENLLLLAWLGIGLVGLGIYKQEIYDHYYGFFFVVPFLLFGAMIQKLYNRSKFVGGLLLLFLASYLLYVNVLNNPVKDEPNRQLQRSETVSAKIIEESGGSEFNLAVIAERNYEGAYQYYLEKENAAIKMIDPQLADETITEQLFVVCELPKDKCKPTTDPKAGIANFGWSKIEKEWEVAGVMLYKLIHY